MLRLTYFINANANAVITNLLIRFRHALQRQKFILWRDIFPARRYASAGNSDRIVSVRPSVCHEPVLCQNEES